MILKYIICQSLTSPTLPRHFSRRPPLSLRQNSVYIYSIYPEGIIQTNLDTPAAKPSDSCQATAPTVSWMSPNRSSAVSSWLIQVEESSDDSRRFFHFFQWSYVLGVISASAGMVSTRWSAAKLYAPDETSVLWVGYQWVGCQWVGYLHGYGFLYPSVTHKGGTRPNLSGTWE